MLNNINYVLYHMQSEESTPTYTLILWSVYISQVFEKYVSERLQYELDDINVYLLFAYYDYKRSFY